jgi:DNA repair protein RadC
LRRNKTELKDSCFDGYEYKGYKVRTKLVIEGHKEYKPLKLSNSSDVYSTFKKLVESDKEKFYSLFLDAKNNLIGADMVSQGSLDSAPVHPREVYKSALLASAANVIFVHSHPSGDPEPSLSDKEITRLLKQAGELLQIGVLDHVIIGLNKYYSFADKGEL